MQEGWLVLRSVELAGAGATPRAEIKAPLQRIRQTDSGFRELLMAGWTVVVDKETEWKGEGFDFPVVARTNVQADELPRRFLERIELFDLAIDPGEHNDIAGQHPGLVSRFTEQLDAMELNSAAFETEQITLDEETIEKLRALGYIE